MKKEKERKIKGGLNFLEAPLDQSVDRISNTDESERERQDEMLEDVEEAGLAHKKHKHRFKRRHKSVA